VRSNTTLNNTRLKTWAVLGVLAATPLTLSACNDQTPRGNSAVTTVPSPTASVVDVRALPGYGKVLVTDTGRALYLFSADPAMTRNCTGYCAQTWPPLVVKGAVRGGPGVNAKLLRTVERSGGEQQVFYAKHALYTYIHDAKPGMTTGERVKTYGGTWWLVSPSGRPVKSTSH
jgi:predicted lipoprotein with Yx(FWY)xxD motif